MKKILLTEDIMPLDFSDVQVGDVVLNGTNNSIFIKQWETPEKYSPQEIPVGEEVTLTEGNLPLQIHFGGDDV